MKIRVVLVEPEYQINLGSIGRLMHNFGLTELFLVNPKTIIGFQAKLFAKKGWPILRKARKVKSLKQAIRGCGVVVGTTGVARRFSSKLKTCVNSRELKEKIGSKEKVCVVFGPEGNGLREEHFRECDVVASIPVPKDSVLNLSHALAILLYELLGAKKLLYEPASPKKIRSLLKMAEKIVYSLPRINDKEKVFNAMANSLKRSRLSDDEVQAVFAVFGNLFKRS